MTFEALSVSSPPKWPSTLSRKPATARPASGPCSFVTASANTSPSAAIDRSSALRYRKSDGGTCSILSPIALFQSSGLGLDRSRTNSARQPSVVIVRGVPLDVRPLVHGSSDGVDGSAQAVQIDPEILRVLPDLASDVIADVPIGETHL